MKQPKKLYRSRTNRILAGICGGIGEYFSIDPMLVRIGFVIVSLFPGPSVIFYLLAWIIIPLQPAKSAK